MTDFVVWQEKHEWFDEKYGKDGYVSLGTCQYPASFAGKHFRELDNVLDKMTCKIPTIIEHSTDEVNKEQE